MMMMAMDPVWISSYTSFIPFTTTRMNTQVFSNSIYSRRPLFLQTRCMGCYSLRVATQKSKQFLTRSKPCYRPKKCFSLVASEIPPQNKNSSEAPEENQQPSQEQEQSTPEESPDILQSPSFLKRKLELVQQELEESKAETSKWEKQYHDQKEAYIRLVAEFENYRKRMNKEKQDIAEVTKANVIRELIAVLDNFERAAAAIIVNTESEQKIHDSYQALAKQLLDAMMKLNVEPIDAVGQPFNPNLHEAVNRVDSEDHEEGIVAMQYQRGYKIGERLVRPALCVVSSGPGPHKKEQPKKKKKEEEEDITTQTLENGVK